MLLPSAADLVRAFVKDLGNLFEGESLDAGSSTIQLTLQCAAGASAIWTADRDYVLLAVQSCSNLVSWVLSFSGITSSLYFSATPKSSIGDVLAAMSISTSTVFPQRTKIREGRTLRLFNGSASVLCLLLTLEVP